MVVDAANANYDNKDEQNGDLDRNKAIEVVSHALKQQVIDIGSIIVICIQ